VLNTRSNDKNKVEQEEVAAILNPLNNSAALICDRTVRLRDGFAPNIMAGQTKRSCRN
jgi:hypothetical protein